MLTARETKTRYTAAVALLKFAEVRVDVAGSDDPDQLALEQAKRERDAMFDRMGIGMP
jgi:hypothetical protein